MQPARSLVGGCSVRRFVRFVALFGSSLCSARRFVRLVTLFGSSLCSVYIAVLTELGALAARPGGSGWGAPVGGEG